MRRDESLAILLLAMLWGTAALPPEGQAWSGAGRQTPRSGKVTLKVGDSTFGTKACVGRTYTMDVYVFLNSLPVFGSQVSVTFESQLGAPRRTFTGAMPEDTRPGPIPTHIRVDYLPTRAGRESIKYWASVTLTDRQGRTTGMINSDPITGRFPVEHCPLEGSLLYHGRYQLPEGLWAMSETAILDSVHLEGDEQGHYEGSGTLTFDTRAWILGAPCQSSTGTTGSGQVQIDGQYSEDGTLNLSLTYDPVTVSGAVAFECRAEGELLATVDIPFSGDVSMSALGLDSVTVAGTGGSQSTSLAQGVLWTTGGEGSATLFIFPEEEAGASADLVSR